MSGDVATGSWSSGGEIRNWIYKIDPKKDNFQGKTRWKAEFVFRFLGVPNGHCPSRTVGRDASTCGRRQWSETSGTEFPLHHLSPLFVRNTPALGLACETTTFMERKKIYRRFCDAISYHARPGMSQLLFSARMPSLILYICKVLYWEKVIKCKKKKGKREREGHLTRFILHWRVARGV